MVIIKMMPEWFGKAKKCIEGTGNDYQYDVDGNMIQDHNKNITNIVYNHMNLPVKILFANGQSIR